MADDPWQGSKRGGTATIKYHKDYDAPWYVATGTPAEIKQDLIDFYGLDPEGTAEQTPHEVFLEAVAVAQATYLAAKGLKGSAGGDEPIANKRGGQRRGGGGWPGKSEGESKPKEPEHPFQGVLDQIAAAKDKAELGRIWATNKPAFQNADVAKASEEKAKSL